MKKILVILSVLVTGILLHHCAGTRKKAQPESFHPQWVTVTVQTENVREYPNGPVIGKVERHDSLLAYKKYGNWFQIDFQGREAYIWAPSCGFPYLNLYNPIVYLHPEKKGFRTLAELKTMLGDKIDTVGGTENYLQLMFTNLGLGEETVQILDVAAVKTETVEKGIVVWYSVPDDEIREIVIDLFRVLPSEKQALRKADVEEKLELVIRDDSQIVYRIFPESELYFILKRREWKSEEISGYRISGKY